MEIELTEAQIKQAVSEYLQYQANGGKLVYLRLNSGEAIVKRGDKSYKLQLCPKGTADFVVFQGVFYSLLPYLEPIPATRVTFLEIKRPGAKQSREQLQFEQNVKEVHCRYYVARSVEEVISLIGEDDRKRDIT